MRKQSFSGAISALSSHDVKQPGAANKRTAQILVAIGHYLLPTHSLVLATQLRPSFDQFPPREGWAERRQAPGACEAPVPANDARGRGACEAPRRPLRSGRRASRRSTPWRFLASGPRFRLRHFLRSTCSQLLAARVVVPGERFPKPPERTVTSRSRGTPRPAPSQARLRRRPSSSRIDAIRSYYA